LPLVLWSLLAPCVTSESTSVTSTSVTSTKAATTGTRTEPAVASSSSSSKRILAQNRFPDNYEDDIFHCSNPNAVNWEISIGCDFDTWEWKLQDLNPEAPPTICTFEIDMDELEDLADIYEPCALWLMEYGDTVTDTDTPSAIPLPWTPGKWLFLQISFDLG
jgi:hypothetical protein